MILGRAAARQGHINLSAIVGAIGLGLPGLPGAVGGALTWGAPGGGVETGRANGGQKTPQQRITGVRVMSQRRL